MITNKCSIAQEVFIETLDQSFEAERRAYIQKCLADYKEKEMVSPFGFPFPVSYYDAMNGDFYWMDILTGEMTNFKKDFIELEKEGSDDQLSFEEGNENLDNSFLLSLSSSLSQPISSIMVSVMRIQLWFRFYSHKFHASLQRALIRSTDWASSTTPRIGIDAVQKSGLKKRRSLIYNEEVHDEVTTAIITSIRRSRSMVGEQPQMITPSFLDLPSSAFEEIVVSTYHEEDQTANTIVCKEYAPEVFQKIRSFFGVSNEVFQNSLGNNDLSIMEADAGRSGSFFYISENKKFILKSVNYSECQLLRHILHSYYEYVTENPNTLLTRYLSLFKVSVKSRSRVQKVYIVAMNNLFENCSPTEAYDLKVFESLTITLV